MERSVVQKTKLDDVKTQEAKQSFKWPLFHVCVILSIATIYYLQVYSMMHMAGAFDLYLDLNKSLSSVCHLHFSNLHDWETKEVRQMYCLIFQNSKSCHVLPSELDFWNGVFTVTSGFPLYWHHHACSWMIEKCAFMFNVCLNFIDTS